MLLRRSAPPSRLFFLAAALLLAGVAAGPLFSEPGLLNTRGGGDSPFLLQRVQQLVTALADGHFPARWMPDANYGYGYPFFHYYAPLSLYIAAFFRLLTFDYVTAIKLAQLAGFLVAAAGMFFLGQRWLGSDAAALLASAAYTLAPFHMVNIYVRGDSLAEFWAMAFFPLVLLAADELLRQPGPLSLLYLSLAYAALVLSHNISALIFTPFLLLFLALGLLVSYRSQNGEFGRRLRLALLALGLALLLSAWFWLPALAETGLAQTDPVTAGFFHYSAHFLTNPVQVTLLFDYDVSGRQAFRMGLVQGLLALPGLVLLLVVTGRSPRVLTNLPSERYPLLFALLALSVATLMLTPLSRPFWDNLPLLPYTQFPWRFLSIQAVATSLLIGSLAWLPARKVLVPLALGLLLVSGLGWLRPVHIVPAGLSSYDLAEYEWFTGNIGSTVSAEYLPQWVQPRPYSSNWLEQGRRNQATFLTGRGQANLTERAAAAQQWQLEVTATPATLMLPTMYWPGWTAQLDGMPLSVQAAPSSGLISVPELPAGTHTLTLQLRRTPLRWFAEALSVAGLMGLIVVAFQAGWFIQPRRALAVVACLLGVLAALFLVARIRAFWQWTPTGPPHNASWDFAQMGYLHEEPAGIPFTDGSRLTSYQYSAPSISAGETLTITLHWEAPAGSNDEVTLALTTPGVHRFKQAPPLVVQTQPLTAEEMKVALPIPLNAPAGLYVPRLTLNGAQALTPAGEPRGDLFLSPVRILPVERPVENEQEGLQVQVDNVSLVGEMPLRQPAGWLPATPFGCDEAGTATSQAIMQLAWATTQPLSHNYNVSLRLLDQNGVELVLCDSQPGYGFRPSSSWPAGQWVPDWLALPLPPQITAAAPYVVTARLYDVGSNEVVLTRLLGQLDWQGEALVFQPATPSFEVPAGIEPSGAVFGEAITLHGYVLEVTPQTLTLALYWGALQPGQEDYQRFVHLVDTTTGQIVSQRDGTPQNESYPTGQWTVGEVITDVVTIDLATLPAGDHYALAVGLYRPEPPGYPRLPAVDAEGRPVAEDRVFLLSNLTLPPTSP